LFELKQIYIGTIKGVSYINIPYTFLRCLTFSEISTDLIGNKLF